jgi:hypothetical protein
MIIYCDHPAFPARIAIPLARMYSSGQNRVLPLHSCGQEQVTIRMHSTGRRGHALTRALSWGNLSAAAFSTATGRLRHCQRPPPCVDADIGEIAQVLLRRPYPALCVSRIGLHYVPQRAARRLLGGKMPQISPIVRNYSWALAKPPDKRRSVIQRCIIIGVVATTSVTFGERSPNYGCTE